MQKSVLWRKHGLVLFNPEIGLLSGATTPDHGGVSSWCNGYSDGLWNRSTRVRTPVALLRSLSGKYPWERFEPPYPPNYCSSRTMTLALNNLQRVDMPLNKDTQSGSWQWSDGNEGVPYIPQSFSIPGTSPSDCLVSYTGHSLAGSYPLCRGAVGVLYSPRWQGKEECVMHIEEHLLVKTLW